ncbi:hypothetical protein [Bradyrhizobium liaoningense]|uniref:hypothetical protein n=1 Tax=Bradyrhizobium liaoningense TaxID=43992 RepID=UPI001FEB4A0F|nr:hypothetical protein [Bradyrhizobium liaoningense]
MMEFAIFSFLVGTVFGRRFTVIALLPLALGLALATVVLNTHLALSEGLKRFAAGAIALQMGYLAGSIANVWRSRRAEKDDDCLDEHSAD